VTGDWRKLVMRSFITCALCQVKLEWWSQGGWDGKGM
jgi:hypothetical protein